MGRFFFLRLSCSFQQTAQSQICRRSTQVFTNSDQRQFLLAEQRDFTQIQMLNVHLQPLKLNSSILMFPVHLEPGAAALHQQQLQVLTGLRVFASLQGLVDPVGQLPSTRSKLHEAPPPSQQPQLLQVT